jgi:hypothetical protein
MSVAERMLNSKTGQWSGFDHDAPTPRSHSKWWSIHRGTGRDPLGAWKFGQLIQVSDELATDTGVDLDDITRLRLIRDFIMTRDGDCCWDCFDDERERFDAVIERIIEELREPTPSSGMAKSSRSPTARAILAGLTASWLGPRSRAMSTSSSTRDNVTECSPL